MNASGRFSLPGILAALATLLFAPSAFAQVDEYRALGKPATAVTGDIITSDGHIQFKNGRRILLDLIGNNFTVDGKRINASAYRVTSTADPVLENGKRLCATGPVTYVVSWNTGRGTSAMGVFTGKEPPKTSAEACAVYTYKYVGPVSIPKGGG